MNISAAYSLNCADLYRFFILSLTADKDTFKTDTTLDQLANFVGESRRNYDSGKISTSFTDRLIKSNEVELEYIRTKSLKDNREVKRIIYTFKKPIPYKYRRIGRDFMNLDLNIKLKGYLLKLFALANTHSLDVEYSVSAISRELKMAKATVNKYNNELIEKGLLSLDGNKFVLHIESFLIDMPRGQTVKTELLIQQVENVISIIKESKLPLPKSYMQYLAAKKNKFKDIRNMEYFMSYVIAGVPFKNKNENNNPQFIM